MLTPQPLVIHGVRFAAFVAMADWMQLNHAQRIALLDALDDGVYQDWVGRVQRHEPLTLDGTTRARIRAIVPVYAALRAVFPVDAEALTWLKGPHWSEAFAGRSPLGWMSEPGEHGLTGAGYVRRYLEAWAAGNSTGY